MAAGFKTATVNASDVPSTQTDFPSYVDLDRLGVTTLAEAQSIRVYADEAKTVEWAREIVSATEMHVKVPSLTSTVDIYVDWDGVRIDYATTATYGRNAVWSDYYLVWHGDSLNESSGGQTLASSGGITLGDSVGQIAEATDFLGSNDYISTSNSYLMEYPYSVQGWVKPDSTAATGVYMARYTAANTDNMFQFAQSGGDVFVRAFVSSGGFIGRRTSGGISTSWAMYHGTFESSVTSDSDVKIYKDGAVPGTGGEGGSGTVNESTERTYMGVQNSLTGDYSGLLDEMRIAKSTLQPNWITTEYNNQNDEATFWGTWTDAGGGGGGAAQTARRGVIMMM